MCSRGVKAEQDRCRSLGGGCVHGDKHVRSGSTPKIVNFY